MPRAKAESHSDHLIAQLSDLHLTRPGVFFNGTCDGWARFSNALASIAELTPKPDCLVISGDIADRPSRGCDGSERRVSVKPTGMPSQMAGVQYLGSAERPWDDGLCEVLGAEGADISQRPVCRRGSPRM